jgi:ferredoxin--NADP+ reductase
VDLEKNTLLSTGKVSSFPPLNTHGVGKAGKNPPFIGKVLSVERLGGRDKERDVTHIVIDTGGVAFVEGQSFGVQPPGTKITSKGEVPQHVRLYSIASSRYGDYGDGNTCTLCVVRVIYPDPKTGEEKRGLCSNYLADVKPGDELVMTGPSGTALLLSEEAHNRPVVCVATGTGIAPFRSFWRRLVFDAVPGKGQGGHRSFGPHGMFWLLAGFANEDSVLYGDELAAAVEAEPNHVRVDIALSLQQKNASGGPNYVQDRIEENADAFLRLMASDDALFYFCGLKRMYCSVLEVLERVGNEKGIDAVGLIAKLKKEHRWHVETA